MISNFGDTFKSFVKVSLKSLLHIPICIEMAAKFLFIKCDAGLVQKNGTPTNPRQTNPRQTNPRHDKP